ncbi:extracellular solute-binding protein [Paenibacillus macquariensis]|uniref:Aldouronate transport system substrate-binding protein n=1 Tax=Paenibacillus macquariensis TaxID=948756 RepID=A0ABY1JMB2_9BACL|nr:extracellular solute-binding protein [Paenibacillus macquariensis]MEC0090638.1 extracellular solute-binding protein [Paenibacillus macquariensis]OAB25066.1 ABC transporter substrate-binding protein [Paenibacillus macquariensis subsp. macquariensis]SIQ45490.1 putative aldouronate transport system substrate-binding protein [Paenibacillus macquariensis]
MSKSKKCIQILLAGMLIVLTACSNSSSSKESPNSSTKEAETPAVQKEADPFGKSEEPITIKIGKEIDASDKSLPAGDSPESNQYTRYIKDKLNIDTKIIWQAAAGKDYEQKINLSIASDDLPDALVVNETQFRQMVKSGQLEDLTDVYNEYASPTIKGIIETTKGLALKSVTIDEKMYALPNVTPESDMVHYMWIRKDWLDKLGLQTPKTIDELEKVAKAFVEQDPDGNGKADTVGITGPQLGGNINADFINPNSNNYGFDPIFASFHSYPGYWLKDSNGKTTYGSIQPETKQALSTLRDFYTKGLIDREMSIRKDAQELIKNGTSGIYFGVWWSGGYGPLGDAIQNNPKANWQAYAVPLDINGEFTPHMGNPSNQYLVVRKGYEHPEAAIQMQNLLFRDESKFDVNVAISNYPLRLVFASMDVMDVTYKMMKEVLAGTKKPEDLNLPGYNLLKTDAENIKKVKLEPYDNYDIQYWNPNADIGVWKRMYSTLVGISPLQQPYKKTYSVTYSQTKTMERRWAALDKLEKETFLKIIMGAEPIDSFDQFVLDWKKQGGDQIIAEVDEVAKQ